MLGKRATLLVIGTALALAIGELAVRRLTRFHESAPRVFMPARDIPWQLKPGAADLHTGYWREFSVPIRINALGYRDRGFALAHPPGVCRVLVLGDSFTFGHGVRAEDTYVKVLERALNTPARAYRYEVINAGYASGNATDTALVYFRGRGAELKPDVVLLGFFEGNDIDDERFTRWPEVDGHGWPTRVTNTVDYADSLGRLRTSSWFGLDGARVPAHPLIAAAKTSVRDHSELANFVLQQYRLRVESERRVPNEPATGSNDGAADSHDAFAEEKTRASLDGLRELTRRAGAALAIVSIPDKGRRHASPFIRSWTSRTGTPLVDLGSRGDGRPDLFMAFDGHWTSEAHARAGTHLAGDLARDDVLAACPRTSVE